MVKGYQNSSNNLSDPETQQEVNVRSWEWTELKALNCITLILFNSLPITKQNTDIFILNSNLTLTPQLQME